MLLWFLATDVDKALGIMSKGSCGFHFYEIKKTSIIFGTIAVTLAIQDLITGKASLDEEEETLIVPMIVNTALYLTDDDLFSKDSFNA